jgi:hypothetical protein
LDKFWHTIWPHLGFRLWWWIWMMIVCLWLKERVTFL